MENQESGHKTVRHISFVIDLLKAVSDLTYQNVVLVAMNDKIPNMSNHMIRKIYQQISLHNALEQSKEVACAK